MVEQSTLLQLIQFVALLAPALAILIELIVKFHGGIQQFKSDKELPRELLALFVGFVFIMFGGMIVGLQMVLTLNNQSTKFAALLIFGGLPFLSFSVVLMNIRLSSFSLPGEGPLENITFSLRYMSSIVLPVVLTGGIYYYLISHFADDLNSNLGWWIFAEDIKTVWYSHIIVLVIIAKILYSMWNVETIPSNKLEPVLEHWFVGTFTAIMMYLLFAGIPFIIYYILFYFFSGTNIVAILSPVPYIWGSIVLLAVLVLNLDPNEEENTS